MASIKEFQKRLEVLEAETAGYGGAKFITFATLYSTGEILSAAVDGQTVERLNAETDQDFRARLMKQYASPETLTVSRTHYAKPKVMDVVYVESNGNGEPVEKADNPEPGKFAKHDRPDEAEPRKPDQVRGPVPVPRPAPREVVEVRREYGPGISSWMS